MDQVIEQVIVVPQDELNEDLAATQAAFFNADGTPFSFSEGVPGEGVSEEFVNNAIATALAELPEGISEEFVTGAIATAISGLPVGRTEEQVTAAIEDAIIDLTGTAYVTDAIATAVDGLASETFVSDALADAVSTTITNLVNTAINGLLDGAPGALDTLNELAAAINDDASFAATVTSALANKQPTHANLTALAGLTLTNGYFLGVNGGALTLRSAAQTKSDLSLGNVDNTADSAKPVSTAQQTALDLKINTSSLSAVTNDAQVPKTLFDAKGDILISTANDTPAKMSVGADGSVLKAQSGETNGLVYGFPESLTDKYTKPSGSYQTFQRQCGLADQAVLGTGRITLVAIALPKGLTVTNIAFFSLATAASAPTHGWFSLCDNLYAALRSTADFTTEAWAANAKKEKALSSPFVTTYEGLYYLALMITATTPPTMACASQNTAGVNSVTPLVSLHGLTGQTSAPSDGTNLASSPSNQSQMMWAYVT